MLIINLLLCAVAMGLTFFICKYLDSRLAIKKNLYQRYGQTARGTWLKIALALGVCAIFVFCNQFPDTKYAFNKLPSAIAFMVFAYFVNYDEYEKQLNKHG